MKTILVTGARGGLGKTTAAACLIDVANIRAYADCDFEAPGLELALPPKGDGETIMLEGKAKATIAREKCDACGICEKACRFSALFITEKKMESDPFLCEGCGVCERVCPQKAIALEPVVAGHLTWFDKPSAFLSGRLYAGFPNNARYIRCAKKIFFDRVKDVPICLIEGIPGFDAPAHESLKDVDTALIITEPYATAKEDLLRLIRMTRTHRASPFVAINRCDIDNEMTVDIERLCQRFGVPVVGRIPLGMGREGMHVAAEKLVYTIDREN